MLTVYDSSATGTVNVPFATFAGAVDIAVTSIHITQAIRTGSDVTFTFAVEAGPPLTAGMYIGIFHMATLANNGTFRITRIAADRFTVTNAGGSTEPLPQVGFGQTVAVQTVAVSLGSLPPGLTIAPQIPGAIPGFPLISGTPSTPGSYPFTLTVTDYAGNTGTHNCTINITALQNANVTVNPWLAPPATSLQPYSFTFTGDFAASVGAGSAPYSWSMTSIDSFGLTLSPSGVLSAARVLTQGGRGGEVVYPLLLIHVTGTSGTATMPVKLVVFLTGTMLYGLPPDGDVGVPYSFTFGVRDNIPPDNFALVGFSQLPAGLTLNPSTGTISGTPTIRESVEGIIISVSDAANGNDQLPYFPLTITMNIRLPGFTGTFNCFGHEQQFLGGTK